MKFTVLIPLADNNGKPFAKAKLAAIADRFSETFGGSTVEGPVSGTWKNAAGELARDQLLKLTVVTSNNREDEARRMARRLCRELKQDAIYFELDRDDGVEFLT